MIVRLRQLRAGASARLCWTRALPHCVEGSHEDCTVCRRGVLFGAAAVLGATESAPAEAGFDKYIKKKALDPLVSYIPVLLIASEQLDYVQLAASDLGCDETRSLLRKGAFVGLRDNIRSVGEYSSETCGKETAQARVKRVFASLEALDGALLVASREKEPKVPGNLGMLVTEAQDSITSLLVDVPADDMQKAKEVVAVVNGKETPELDSPSPSVSSKAAERLEALL